MTQEFAQTYLSLIRILSFPVKDTVKLIIVVCQCYNKDEMIHCFTLTAFLLRDTVDISVILFVIH